MRTIAAYFCLQTEAECTRSWATLRNPTLEEGMGFGVPTRFVKDCSLGDPLSLTYPPHSIQPWRPVASHLSSHPALETHGHSPIPPPSLGDPLSLPHSLTQPCRRIVVSHLSPTQPWRPMVSHLSLQPSLGDALLSHLPPT